MNSAWCKWCGEYEVDENGKCGECGRNASDQLVTQSRLLYLEALEALVLKLIDQSYKDSYDKLYVHNDSIREMEVLTKVRIQNVRPWHR